MAIFLRVFIGIILLASGFEKSLSPYQNFLYVLQSYQIFPSGMDKVIAMTVPWLELFVGVFLVLGLWTKFALKAACVFFLSFICIVGQALIKRLPIDECGCFGEAIHIAPQYIIVFDTLMLLALVWLIKNHERTIRLSLDQYFNSTAVQKP